MRIHDLLLPSEPGQPHHRFIMSDLHLGSPNSDHELIVKQLDRALAVGARVLINGDIFDMIMPSDRKRFDNSVLHPDLWGKKDLAKAVVDMGYDILGPYARAIDVIGLGNHEESYIKHSHGDPITALIAKLDASHRTNHRIRHGSFWGYINTRFELWGTQAKPRHRLLYYHGTGGDSPVTKGTIDINRRGRNWQFDAMTFGHKHNSLISLDQIIDCEDGKMTERTQLTLQTASYYRNYKEITDADDPLVYSYAASKGHPPKPLGGTFLTLRPEKEGRRWVVRQDYSSDILGIWAKKARKAA